MVQLISLVGLLALLQTAIAAPQRHVGASDSRTCVADNKMYRSGHSYRINGINYVVRCAKDSSGLSFLTHKVPFGGFSMCFEICERTGGCAGFSFVGSKEGGNCYLKTSVGGLTTASDETVTCEKDPGGSGGEPEPMHSFHSSSHGPVSSSTSVAHSSTSAHTSSSVSASVSSHSSHHPESAHTHSSGSSTHASAHTHSSGTGTHAPTPTHSSDGQCEKIAEEYRHVNQNGSSYEVQCGADHYGGDFSRANSKFFMGCVTLCDAKPECVGFSYDSGVCYFKSSLSGLRAASGIDFALNLNRTGHGPSHAASSHSSTSPTSASVHHSKSASSTSEVVLVTVTSYTYSATPPSVSPEYSSMYVPSSTHASSTSSEVEIVTVTSYTPSATPSSVASEYSSEEHHHHHHHHTKSHGHHTKSKNYEWIPAFLTKSHHRRPHHNKSHHTKHHHHTTGSNGTVTAYVSETYTHTNFVTSVSPTTPAESYSSHTYTHSPKPTQPYTRHPEAETTVADESHCFSLRNEQPKKLRIEVITGSKEYDGMYVKDPSRDHAGIAHLCSSKDEGASVTLNPNTGAVLSYNNEEGCSFRGLNMRSHPIHHRIGGIRDHYNKERYGDATFSADTASGGMRFASGYLIWKHKLWSFWLACEGEGGEPELKYWGVASKWGSQVVDGQKCSTVKLRVVE